MSDREMVAVAVVRRPLALPSKSETRTGTRYVALVCREFFDKTQRLEGSEDMAEDQK